MTKLILVDYSWCLHRYHHVHKEFFIEYNGEQIFTGSIFGFTRLVQSIHSRFKHEEFRVIFCLDQSSDRKDEYAEYKANRNHQSDVYKEDTYITNILSNLPFVSFATAKNKEADDVIAYLALSNLDKYDEVIVYSGDNDMLQLMSEGVKITREFDKLGFVYVGQDYIKKKYGDIDIKNLLKFRALLGDVSDNISSAASGVKTAFLREFIKKWDEFSLNEALNPELYTTKIKGVVNNLTELHLIDYNTAKVNYKLMNLLKYKTEELDVEHFKRKPNFSLLEILKLDSFKLFLENLNKKTSSSITQVGI